MKALLVKAEITCGEKTCYSEMEGNCDYMILPSGRKGYSCDLFKGNFLETGSKESKGIIDVLRCEECMNAEMTSDTDH
jgi:hypothetical protein